MAHQDIKSLECPMHALDWTVIAVYAAALFGIGVYATRKQSGTDEYFRGSRTIPWWAIGISIIATAFSAASLLGGPGEGYNHGFLWMQLQMGDLIGYALVCLLFIPFFVRLDLTTAYEYLERRFDPKTRCLGAFCFQLFVLARLGALLYGAALVVSQTTGLSLASAILIVGVVSILYTTAGGIAAVIWTDVLQFGMILVGVTAAVWVAASGIEGGLGSLWQTASEAGKLRVIDPSWDPGNIRTLPTALGAYGLLAFAVAGTNQQSVQRYVSCPDVRSAQKAAGLAWLSGFVGVAAAVLLGVVLFAFYQAKPGALPEGIQPDKIFPHFISTELPPGIAGFVVAAIFAAAMSSIDSALHSLSTSMVVDLYRRFLKTEAPEKHYLLAAQLLIVFWGVLGIGAAFYVASTGKSLLPFLVKYTTYFLGPLLGVFLLGICTRRCTARGAFWGALAAVGSLVLLVNFTPVKLPGIWFSAVTVPVTVVLGFLLSLTEPAPEPESLRGLTL